MKKLTRSFASAALSLSLLLPGFASAQVTLPGGPEPYPINILDNGALNVIQRGTTAVTGVTTTATYFHDRWALTAGTSTSSAVSNSTSSPTLPTGFSNAVHIQRTAAQTGTVAVCYVQEIQTLDTVPLKGQNVTLSFNLAAGANLSSASGAVVAQITTGTGTDEGLATWLTGLTGAASAIPTANATVTPTTSYQRFAVTGTIPSTATEAVVNICFTPVGTAGTDDGIYLTGIQLNRGTTAMNFEARPIANELARAQRYFWQVADAAATVQYPSSCFVTAANTTVKCGIWLPVQMRAAPTTTVSTATSFGIVATAGTAGTCTTLAATASSNTVNQIGLTCTTGATIALGSATPLIGAATAGTIRASADF